MDSYQVWVYVHILLFVFWIGTDVGVFILGKFAQSAKYPVEQRLFAMKVALLIDRFPRVCFVLIIPVGMQMAHMSGLLPLSDGQRMFVWGGSAVWLVLVFWGFAVEGQPVAKILRNVERGVQVVAIVAFVWAGLYALTAPEPVTTQWLAFKLLAFAGIILMALGLDLVSGLMTRGMEMLEREGYSDTAQSAVHVGLNRVYAFVVGIYVLALAAAFLGTVKYPI